jgi:hypothetical protein
MGELWRPVIWTAATIGAVVLFIVFLVALDFIAVRLRRRRRDTALLSEFEEWKKKTDAAGGIESANYGLQLPDGEECFYATRATLCEPRAVRVSRHGGVGLRATRRIGVFEGESRSESHDEWRAISSGILYMTNKRVIFAGDMHNRTVKLADILSVSAFIDALDIRTTKRMKSMRFSNINGSIANQVLSLLMSE